MSPALYWKTLAGCALVLVLLPVVAHYFGESGDQKNDQTNVEHQSEPKVYAPREDTMEVLYNVHVFFSDGYRVEYKPEGIDRVVVYSDSSVTDSTRERLKHTNPFSLDHREDTYTEERAGYGSLEWVVFARSSRLGLSESVVVIDGRSSKRKDYVYDSIDLPRRWCKVETFNKRVVLTRVDTLKAGRRSRW